LNKNLNIKLSEVAKLVGGNLVGDPNVVINSVARIDEANKGDITFLYLANFEKYFVSTGASAILVKPDFNKTRTDISYIEVKEPEKAFALILLKFFSPKFELKGIDKTAFVDPTASLGKNVGLGKNVVISANCRIGDNVRIFHNAVLLDNVEVGNDTILFQNVSIREDCKIGKRVIIHPGTVIGADGFGYQKDAEGVYHKVPQIGNVILEDDVEIGANSTIDRAALGSTIVKKGSKIDNLVQIAHNVSLGNNTIMSAQSGISGSVKVGNNSIFAGQVGVAGHLEIGDNIIFVAQSGVSKSITKPGVYFGSPAKDFKTAKILEAHYRNFPEYVERLNQLEEEIRKLREEINHNKS
jgi:UDP-3-O-[3-hydroxymyristoyl] glucosamine N-acyltransferase